MFRLLKNLLAADRRPVHPPRPAARLGLEVLEDRRVLAPVIDPYGNLRIDGTPGDDVCEVYQPVGGPFLTVVRLNGVATNFLRRTTGSCSSAVRGATSSTTTWPPNSSPTAARARYPAGRAWRQHPVRRSRQRLEFCRPQFCSRPAHTYR